MWLGAVLCIISVVTMNLCGEAVPRWSFSIRHAGFSGLSTFILHFPNKNFLFTNFFFWVMRPTDEYTNLPPPITFPQAAHNHVNDREAQHAVGAHMKKHIERLERGIRDLCSHESITAPSGAFPRRDPRE